jgi:nicotinamide-nucleotide amidase
VKAVILSIGDELILGQTVDSNSAWLSAGLSGHGVMTLYHKTVADDVEATVLALKEACTQADVVIVTGGLGPTEDDLTRQALAQFTNRPLDMHPPSLERIRAFFKSLNREMPVKNRIQAMVPRGSEVLDNDWGTAAGIRVQVGKTRIYVLPGVPHEMMKMAEHHIFPHFRRGTGSALAVEALHTFGAGESTVAETLGDLMRRDRNPLVGTTVSGGIVTVRIRSESPTVALARKNLATTVKAVTTRLGSLVFGQGDDTLPGVVAHLCREKHVKVTLAESCTGGLAAKMLTDCAGSSAWFLGGWVTYSNAMKTSELGVPADLIKHEGAVSEAVVETMARNALMKSGADLALSLTGVAGPAGGTADKPVGTVWIALASRHGDGAKVRSERFQFPGTRDMIRDRAAKSAINWLRLELPHFQ